MHPPTLPRPALRIIKLTAMCETQCNYCSAPRKKPCLPVIFPACRAQSRDSDDTVVCLLTSHLAHMMVCSIFAESNLVPRWMCEQAGCWMSEPTPFWHLTCGIAPLDDVMCVHRGFHYSECALLTLSMLGTQDGWVSGSCTHRHTHTHTTDTALHPVTS